jgi:beta-fructofuranosidase
MNTWGAEIPTTKKGWNGALTFPRELFLRDGEVWQRPVGEIGLLRKRELRRGGLSLRAGAEDRLEGLRGDSVEIGFGIPAGAGRSGKFSLCLRASEDGREKAVLGYDFSTRVFSVDTGNSPPVRLPPAEGEGEIPVHILIDTSSLEIFLCGGKYVFSSRIFPRPGSVFYRALAEGLDLTLPGFRAWELG